MMKHLLSRFRRETSGNFAMITAICILPIGIVVGVATDYSRASNARAQMQSLADSAVLAAASSKKSNANDLRQVAKDYVRANARGLVQNVQVAPSSNFGVGSDTITVVLEDRMPTTFMRLAGVDNVDLSAKAEAERGGVTKAAEIALVLDTTYSMNQEVMGERRLDALKRIAATFVDDTMKNGANVRMSVVPYADYVNVGIQRRNAPWSQTPADYVVKHPGSTWKSPPETCRPKTPGEMCTHTVDGVVQTYDCPEQICVQNWDAPEDQWTTHTGGAWDETFKFWGCMFPRVDPNEPDYSNNWTNERTSVRLTQAQYGAIKFEGWLQPWSQCNNELLPLTDNKQSIKNKIDSLELASPWGAWGLSTYIPTGLTWGWNTLSDKNYFPEGTPDPAITKKVMILMSDGANTAGFADPKLGGDKQQREPTGWEMEQPLFAKQILRTKDNMLQLCQNIKDAGIEIFTISFAENDADATSRLKQCATSPDHHYFLAMNAIELQNAFNSIGNALGGKVRLVN